jgi:predicted metal-dependent hydrolase
VAYDVFEAAYGKGLGAYALRIFGFLVSQAIFAVLFAPLFLYAVVRAGALFDWRGWCGLIRHHWAGGGKGLIRRVTGLYWSFFKFGFHPWQHDNTADLARETLRFEEREANLALFKKKN